MSRPSMSWAVGIGGIAAAYLTQLGGYAVSPRVGDLTFIASLALCVASAFFVGTALGGSRKFLAAMVCAVLGWGFCAVSLPLLQWFRVDVIRDVTPEIFAYFALVPGLAKWPVAVLSGLAGFVGAMRRT